MSFAWALRGINVDDNELITISQSSYYLIIFLKTIEWFFLFCVWKSAVTKLNKQMTHCAMFKAAKYRKIKKYPAPWIMFSTYERDTRRPMRGKPSSNENRRLECFCINDAHLSTQTCIRSRFHSVTQFIHTDRLYKTFRLFVVAKWKQKKNIKTHYAITFDFKSNSLKLQLMGFRCRMSIDIRLIIGHSSSGDGIICTN